MSEQRRLRASCERAWRQGLWDQQLVEDAWTLTSHIPSPENLQLAIDVQQSVEGLHAHHLDLTEHYVREFNRPWQAITLRLLSARVYAGQINQAQALLEQQLGGKITPYRTRLLMAYPQVLGLIYFLQKDRLPHTLKRAGLYARWIQKTTTRFCPDFANYLASGSATASNRLRIAVVGNAQCLLDRRDGPVIDAHDLVIRFNAASLSQRYVPHTGSRTDVWVISPSLSYRQKNLPASALVLSGIHPLAGRCRFWKNLHKRRVPLLATFPPQYWYSLVDTLNAPPSAGLLMLTSLKGHPATTVNAFGFSGPQQLSNGSAGLHYSDLATPSSRHNWKAEAGLIEQHFSDWMPH